MSDIKETVEPQESRLAKVELSLKAFSDAAEIAAGERRDTKRLIKGSAIGIVMVFITTGLFGYYGLKGTSNTAAAVAATAAPAQEAKKQDEALAERVEKLTQALEKDRVAREKEAPTTVRSRRGQGRSPEPVPGPYINMFQEKEVITTDPTVPYVTLRALSRPGGL